MVAEEEDTSCPELTDVLDQLSVIVRPDPEIESYGPVILDPNSRHKVNWQRNEKIAHSRS